MIKIDLSTKALLMRRELAEKATPGPWEVSNFMLKANDQLIAHLDDYFQKDMDFVAANDPSTVQADIDEILRLREENGRLDREAEWLADKLKQYKGEFITCREGVMSLREAARRAVEEQQCLK